MAISLVIDLQDDNAVSNAGSLYQVGANRNFSYNFSERKFTFIGIKNFGRLSSQSR